MIYTDDPVHDWDAYCREVEAQHANDPVCDICGEQTFEYYDIDGEIICPDCIRNFYKEAE